MAQTCKPPTIGMMQPSVCVLFSKPPPQTSPSPLPLRRRHRCQPRICSAPGKPTSAVGPLTRLDLPTVEVQRMVRFTAVPWQQGKAVVVESVLADSAAAAAGVRPGQQLVEVSDPVRNSETWQLNENSSLRYVRDAIRMRASASITLVLAPGPELEASALAQRSDESDSDGDSSSVQLLGAITGSEASRNGTNGPNTATGPTPAGDPPGAAMTIAQKMEMKHKRRESRRQNTALEERVQRRKDYMQAVGQRDDSTFFAVVGALFLLPPLVILAVAAASGYLDTLAAGVLQVF